MAEHETPKPKFVFGLHDRVRPPSHPVCLDLRVSEQVREKKKTRVKHGRFSEDDLGYDLLPPGLPALRILEQRNPRDCGIACLSMLSNPFPYDAVEKIAAKVLDRKLPISGMRHREVVKVGAELGLTFKLRVQYDLDYHTGILSVRGKEDTEYKNWGHYVVLYRGLLFDTDCCVYRYQDYLKCYEYARFGSLLKLEVSCQP